MTATKVVPYRSGTEFQEGLDTAVDWLVNDNLDFACVYTNQPDKAGHR